MNTTITDIYAPDYNKAVKAAEKAVKAALEDVAFEKQHAPAIRAKTARKADNARKKAETINGMDLSDFAHWSLNRAEAREIKAVDNANMERERHGAAFGQTEVRLSRAQRRAFLELTSFLGREGLHINQAALVKEGKAYKAGKIRFHFEKKDKDNKAGKALKAVIID